MSPPAKIIFADVAPVSGSATIRWPGVRFTEGAVRGVFRHGAHADGLDHDIDLQFPVGTRNLDGPPPAGIVLLSEFGPDQTDGLQGALLVGDVIDGLVQQQEVDAGLQGGRLSRPLPPAFARRSGDRSGRHLGP